MKSFFRLIKEILKYVFVGYEKERLMSELLRIQPFDVVSIVPNPEPKDLYILYNITDVGDVYLTKWSQFVGKCVYNAGIDTQYVYNLKQASIALFKVVNYKMKFEDILSRASKTEFNTFAMRMYEVFGRSYPLLGMFVDKRDDHLMLITDVIGNLDTGACEVIDLDVLPLFGVVHFHQFVHMIPIKNILDEYSLFPMIPDKFSLIMQRHWNPKALSWMLEAMVRAIRKSERKSYRCDLRSSGLTVCTKTPPETQNQNTLSKEKVT